jgi:hypothetical protein
MDMLLDQKDYLSEWEEPKEWTALECRPLEFKEYLMSKWGTELGLVLVTPLDQIGWWNHKQTAPEQVDCFAKQLVRVPNLDREPLQNSPVHKFLLHDNPVSFIGTLKKVLLLFVSSTFYKLFYVASLDGPNKFLNIWHLKILFLNRNSFLDYKNADLDIL